MPNLNVIVIKAYARLGNAERADALLWQLYDIASRDNEESSGRNKRLLPPDVVTIAACINAWVSGENAKKANLALVKAGSLLDLIIDAYKHDKVLPDQRNVDAWIFENVIRLWSISKRPEAGDKAEYWIDRMHDLSETVSDHFEPTFKVYTLALDAHASSNRKDAGKRVVKLLERMQQLSEQGRMEPLNVRALSSALTSITKMRSPLGVEYSQKVFQLIVKLYKEGDRGASINAQTFSSVLTALARGNDVNADAISIDLLHQMRELSESGLKNFAPNTISYNCVLNLLAKRGLPEKAEMLLNEMMQQSAKGDSCAPDTVSYSCVCRAFANSNHSDAAQRTEAILALVEEKYQEGDITMKPDPFLYNAVLTSLARAAKTDASAATRADNLLKRMELSSVSDNPVRPDVVSFSSVCQAYAISGAPERALAILEKVENEACNGHMDYPDAIFYSALALAFLRSEKPGSLQHAEDIIRRMRSLQEAGRKNIQPSTLTYNSLLSGWAKSRERDKLQKASILLEEMEKTACTGEDRNGPDIFSYNW
jgi:pentatricopeptide repeat protein